MGVRSPLLKTFGDEFAWSLLDAVPDATFLIAHDGEIVFVNEQAGVLFGCAADVLLGRVVEDLLPEGLHAVHRAHRAHYRHHPSVRAMGTGVDLRARRPDGSEFPVRDQPQPGSHR